MLEVKRIRVIPRLDVKGPNVVKGIHLEGLRVVGKPAELARKYYEEGADELLYIDIVASLYERNNLMDVVEQAAASGVFIPITVGGGLRTIEDIRKILRSGADKAAINTAATRNPAIISEAARIFGSQCIVGSIEAKKQGDSWEAYIENGRERTGLDAVSWARKLAELGAGELLVTSVDKEGEGRGFDTELIRKIVDAVDIPVIASGGGGRLSHFSDCISLSGCDAISSASMLHYRKATIEEIKQEVSKVGFVRPVHHACAVPGIHRDVTIIDYGAGNLKSVITAFRTLGCEVTIADNPTGIEKASYLVLPGDGAFGYGMQQLSDRRLIAPILAHISQDKPFIGICLGMQLLLASSEEFGFHEGLGVVPGHVRKMITTDGSRIPHMGWNSLVPMRQVQGTILEGVSDPQAYFVHSYCVEPGPYGLADTSYGGESFCTIIQQGRLFATQFHPEKSGQQGLMMLYNYLKQAERQNEDEWLFEVRKCAYKRGA